MNRRHSAFSIFALLYITAVCLEMSEDWENPGFTLLFLVVAAGIIITGITRVKFLVFLIAATAYFLIVQFPEVANHVNFIIYCNVMMMVALAYPRIRRRENVTDAEYFEMISPLLRVSLVLLYFIAGFHKLNADYFNSRVSCANSMLGRVISMMRTEVFGLPAGTILLAVCLFVLYRLLRAGRFGAPASRMFSILVVIFASSLVCSVLVILLPPYFGRIIDFETIGLTTGVLTISWELIGSLLLVIPKLQAVLVPFSLVIHAVLAMVGFVDFGALALSLLFAFVPPSYYQVLRRHANLRLRRFSVNRADAYFAINIVGAAYSGFSAHLHPLADEVLLTGALFDLALIVAVWPILLTWFSSSPRPPWNGVPLLNGKAPKFLYVFPLMLALIGATSYVGLRTAGNFSMFSNLRTEGKRSNHLLLRSNPLKIWNFQEDIVRITEIDQTVGKPIHHFKQLQTGYQLPVVEFRKWIYTWTQAGLVVPLTFEYRGETYSTKDVTSDPAWRTDRRTWAMVLMDFRVIQPEGPNGCRW